MVTASRPYADRWLRHLMRAAMVLPLVAFGCVRLMEPGTFHCESDEDCGSAQKCLSEECVAQNYCWSHQDCGGSQRCEENQCELAECRTSLDPACGAFLCSLPERRCYDQCSGVAECRAPHRCHQPSRTCRMPVANGGRCDSSLDCASGICCAQLCADRCGVDGGMPNDGGMPTDGGMLTDGGAAGAVCTEDTDCASTACCATATAPARLCRAQCPALTGDYCTAGFASERECEEAGAFCDGPTNFPENGYCSRDCTAGCGYASNGRANVCIRLNPGSSPAQACKPGCTTDADCQAVHPLLLCFGTTRKACDFDTGTWLSVD